MNCILFVKMDQIFSYKNQNIEKLLEKPGNFVRSEKWEPYKTNPNPYLP